MKTKEPTVAEDLIADFTEFVEALEADENLNDRLNCSRMELDLPSDGGRQAC